MCRKCQVAALNNSPIVMLPLSAQENSVLHIVQVLMEGQEKGEISDSTVFPNIKANISGIYTRKSGSPLKDINKVILDSTVP